MKLINVWRIIVCVVLTLAFVSIVIDVIVEQKLEMKDAIYGLFVLACLVAYSSALFKRNNDKEQKKSD